jgi:MFS transporter, DHA2 family, multidrug resistance protein
MAEANVIKCGPVSTGAIGIRPVFAVGAVLIGSFLASFDTRLFSLALPDIRGAMSLTFDEGAWLSTVTSASQILIAPAVAWMATVFGLRRVLGIPSLVYAVISLLIPFVKDYNSLLALSFVHGILLGTFVPATLMIIFRNLPIKWWLPAIAVYCIRVGFSMNSGVSLTGFYVGHVGWQWMYWQDVFVAPLMALFVYLGTPHEGVNKELLKQADWGGMLLLGVGMAMIYAGLDQGNRLDWLGSGAVSGLLAGGGLLCVGFFINEALVSHPWAHFEVLFSRNIGLALTTTLLYTFTSISNTSLAPNFLTTVAQLRPEQSGPLFFFYAVLPMALLVPLSIYLIRHHDVRLVLVAGLASFAVAGLLGTQLTHDWSLNDFVPMVFLQSVGQSFTLLSLIIIVLSNSDPTRATAFSAYIQVMRLGGAEIGVALMGTWLRIREQINSNLIGLKISSGSADVAHALARLTSRFISHGVGSAHARGAATLAATVQREANTMAYVDGFWLTVCFAVAALICAAMIGTAPPGPLSPEQK